MKVRTATVIKSLCSLILGVATTAMASAAGNVNVTVVNDELRITGDSSGNEIQIEQTVLNRYKVKGINGTKVNGKNDDTFRVKKGIVANLNSGNDVISIIGEGLGILQDNIDGNLQINMGAGNDKVNLGFLAIEGFTLINMGDGTTDQVNADFVVDQDFFTVISGSGNDKIDLSTLVAESSIAVKTQGGNDDIKINLASAFIFQVDSGIGNDIVNLDAIQSNTDLELFAGAGNDNVTVENSEFEGFVGIVGDDGEDEIVVRDVVGEQLFAFLGDDDDLLEIRDVVFDEAQLDGEDGDNILLELGDNDIDTLNVDNFED